MLFLLVIIPLCLLSAKAQEVSYWGERYFENRAKNFAVITARYAAKGYYFSKEVTYAPAYIQLRAAYADTAEYYLKQALFAADSCLFNIQDTTENDSIIMGVAYLRLSEHYLRKANHLLELVTAFKKPDDQYEQSSEAMFLAGNAIVEAYNASLYLRGNREKTKEDTSLPDTALADLSDTSRNQPFGGFRVSNSPERIRQIKRLEADETTYSAMVDLYEQKIKIIDKQISSNDSLSSLTRDRREKERLISENEQLSTEHDTYAQKLRDANKELKKLRDILSQVMVREAQKSRDAPPLKASEFDLNKTGYYTAMHPIPLLDEDDSPMGLVFKVQIGYYSLHSKPKWFDGLYPVTGYKVSERYIRYTTGIFYDFNEADKAKEEIRQKGIKDAFVIAYYDGEKISVSHAIRIWLDEIEKNK